MGVLHSFSIKNIFYDKMDLKLFYFDVTMCLLATDFILLIINGMIYDLFCLNSY